MLGINGEYPAGYSKDKFWQLFQKIAKHFIDKSILPKFIEFVYNNLFVQDFWLSFLYVW